MTNIPILILEHDANDLELLLYTLDKSDLNYTWLAVETQEQYEEALLTFKPSIVLSDNSLPSFDGLTAYSIKHTLFPDTPFIMVSGTIGEERAVELIKNGITDYVLKESMYQVVPKIKRALLEVNERIEKRNTELQLERQNQEMRNLLENIIDGFFTVDRNWIITFWNKVADRLLAPTEKVINKPLWEVFPEAVYYKFFREYNRVMNEGVSTSFEEFYDVLDIWVSVNAYPTKDGISIFFKDITESKRQEHINKLEKDVLEHFTSKQSNFEETIQLLLSGVRPIHPQLAYNMQKVVDGKFYNWGYSNIDKEYIDAIEAMPVEMTNGSFGAAAITKQKAEVTNISDDPGWGKCRGIAAKQVFDASSSYPYCDTNQNVLGVFTVYLKTCRDLTKSEERTIERVRYILKHLLENYVAEIALKASEEKYRDLFQLNPIPLWLYDIETLEFLDVNEAALRHYGYSLQEFLGMTIKDIRPPEDIPLLEEKILHLIKSDNYSYGSFRHKKKNGENIYVDIKSNKVIYNNRRARLILAQDITEKIKTEEALSISEQRFKALVQEGADLINIIDFEGNYKYASPASATMMGVDPEQISALNAFNFIHPDDREMIVGALSSIVSEKRIKTGPFRFKDNTGEYRWLESVGTNLADDPAIKGIVVNSSDVTERINYIAAIESQNKKLKEIAWMQSHVVRAPLARIMGLIQVMSENHQDDQKDKQINYTLLQHILTSAYELDEIIREIVMKAAEAKNIKTDQETPYV